jgi:hypothetical protein
MTSLEQLRSRWKKSPWKEIKEKVVKILKDSKDFLIEAETPDIFKQKMFEKTRSELKKSLQDYDFVFREGLFDLKGIDLEDEDLRQIFLMNFDLSGAILKRTVFTQAHFKFVDLRSADLTYANLYNTELERLTFGNYNSEKECTNLERAELRYAKFIDTKCFDVKYGKYCLDDIKKCEKAEGSYRVLKNLFKDVGNYKEADKCYRLERKAKRKQKNIFYRIIEWLLYEFTCGYGMRPWYVFFWIAGIVLLFMCLYSCFGDRFIYNGNIEATFTIKSALYLSVVTFTTLGLGDWHPAPNSNIQYLVAVEAILGAIFIALAMITYARKMIRS